MEKCSACGAPIENNRCSFCGANYQTQSQSQPIPQQPYIQYAAPVQQQVFQTQPMAGQVPVYVTPKSKGVALLLCIFLGYFGAHKFYLGRTGMGIIYLLTLGLFGIGWVVDIFLILLTRVTDSRGVPIQ